MDDPRAGRSRSDLHMYHVSRPSDRPSWPVGASGQSQFCSALKHAQPGTSTQDRMALTPTRALLRGWENRDTSTVTYQGLPYTSLHDHQITPQFIDTVRHYSVVDELCCFLTSRHSQNIIISAHWTTYTLSSLVTWNKLETVQTPPITPYSSLCFVFILRKCQWATSTQVQINLAHFSLFIITYCLLNDTSSFAGFIEGL